MKQGLPATLVVSLGFLLSYSGQRPVRAEEAISQVGLSSGQMLFPTGLRGWQWLLS